MNPRVTRSLKLLFLVLLVAFFSLPSVTDVANAAACNTSCWEDLCYVPYFECVGRGTAPSVCCRTANQCANFCGSDCPLFC